MSVTLPESLADPRPRRDTFRRAGNYHLAVLSEAFRAPLRWAARRSSRTGLTPPSAWRRGLIIGPSHIGDVLYNTPALPALHAGLPDCEWVFAASGASTQVLEGNPNLEAVVAIPSLGTEIASTCALLAPYQFDVIIAYTGGPALTEMRIALRLEIPNRVGYVHRGFSGLINHPVSIHFPKPYPAYFRDLVRQLTGPATPATSSLRPLVYLRPEHHQIAEQTAARLGLEWKKQPVLACAVTSRQPSGIWPAERFLETICHVRARRACTILYTGAKSDQAQLEQMAQATGADAFVLAGELDLLPFVALLSRCQAALAPDSGTRHLANAACIPVVFPRNISFRQAEAGCYCETDHDMAPADLEMIDAKDQAAAFAAIDPAQVGDELIRLLDAGSTRARTH